MWPWGHLVFGAVVYVVYRRIRELGIARVAVGVSLAIGTQFPDLVDKPLAWNLGLLPTGRSLAHSMLTFALVAVVLYRATKDGPRSEEAVAFLAGYGTHIVGDVLPVVVAGDLDEAVFVFWPLVPAVDYGPEIGAIARFRALELTPSVVAQMAVAVVVVLWWYARSRAEHG
ncbi:putative membrane-bound metal-dependent hydrolase [Haloferax mucosum ATCC BAA-1512]|uniref:Putative membrane-bound metal-dependent hydrolase n=1 Tax=Haloferax mucosum ATCC BAA-1512 TaxID=662479 RepID=M0IPU1_9EURY|nr:metal-dependent hydrolase [Haloferax mucosum]ELZ98027.1 putative membrane-bound metal-dependent hydrolase [Haloferax mucosum ATCC BAA-1512]